MIRSVLAISITLALGQQAAYAACTAYPDASCFTGNGPQTITDSGVNTPSYMVSSYDDAASLTLSDSVVDNSASTMRYGVEVEGNTGASLVATNDTITGQTAVLTDNGDVNVDINNSILSANGATSSKGWVTALDVLNDSTTGATNVTIENGSLVTDDVVISANAAASLNIDDSVIDGAISLSAFGDVSDVTTANISNSTIASSSAQPSFLVEGVGDVNVAISHTTITQTGAAQNESSVLAVSDDSDANMSITDSSLQNGAYVYAYQGNSNLDIADSSILGGAYAKITGGNAAINIVNSQIGPADTSSSYTVLASSSGNATSVNIENSTVDGNVGAQALGDESAQGLSQGSSVVSLSQGSTVNGYIYALGIDNTINIDDATLNGNIYTGDDYHDGDTGTVNTIINLSNTAYRDDIKSEDDAALTDNLAININDGAEIGGLTEDSSQKITGYDNVDVSLNYLNSDEINQVRTLPTDITTLDHTTYFYISNDENVQLDGYSATGGTLPAVRSGSYLLNNVSYATQKTSSDDDGSTYAVAFYTQNSKPGPLPDNGGNTPDDGGVTPDDGGDTPPSSNNVVNDIQAAQAGLVASDDMIHRIADDITYHLDTRQNGGNIWISGIHAGSDRTASQSTYENSINGAQFGGYLSFTLANDDTIMVGVANGYLHNALDLSNKDGHNSVNGTYYSVYGRWEQPVTEKQMRWFADSVLTYGNMSYSASGSDAGIHAGGNYDGNTWLAQARSGMTTQAGRFELQPYVTLGYVNTQTDSFNDGYSQIGEGKQVGYFAGGGVRVATELAVKDVQSIQPYLTTGYNAQFGGSTHLNTDDYSFAGENLNGGNAGAGVTVKFNSHWAADAHIGTEFGHAIDNAVEGGLTLSYSI